MCAQAPTLSHSQWWSDMPYHPLTTVYLHSECWFFHYLWGLPESCFRVHSSPTVHTLPTEPICKLSLRLAPPAPLLASGVPLNCPTHSLLECVCLWGPPTHPNHTSNSHVHTAALAPATGGEGKSPGLHKYKEPLDKCWLLYTAFN